LNQKYQAFCNKELSMTQNNYDRYAVIIGGGERAGLKPPAQRMEAISAGSMQRLRAFERVGFSRLLRTEAGIYPAEHHRKHAPAKVVKLPFYEPEWKKK
jgi:hypothetical protein